MKALFERVCERQGLRDSARIRPSYCYSCTLVLVMFGKLCTTSWINCQPFGKPDERGWVIRLLPISVAPTGYLCLWEPGTGNMFTPECQGLLLRQCTL